MAPTSLTAPDIIAMMSLFVMCVPGAFFATRVIWPWYQRWKVARRRPLLPLLLQRHHPGVATIPNATNWFLRTENAICLWESSHQVVLNQSVVDNIA